MILTLICVAVFSFWCDQFRSVFTKEKTKELVDNAIRSKSVLLSVIAPIVKEIFVVFGLVGFVFLLDFFFVYDRVGYVFGGIVTITIFVSFYVGFYFYKSNPNRILKAIFWPLRFLLGACGIFWIIGARPFQFFDFFILWTSFWDFWYEEFSMIWLIFHATWMTVFFFLGDRLRCIVKEVLIFFGVAGFHMVVLLSAILSWMQGSYSYQESGYPLLSSMIIIWMLGVLFYMGFYFYKRNPDPHGILSLIFVLGRFLLGLFGFVVIYLLFPIVHTCSIEGCNFSN
jgi:hypothetical protein